MQLVKLIIYGAHAFLTLLGFPKKVVPGAIVRIAETHEIKEYEIKPKVKNIVSVPQNYFVAKLIGL
jgi:hypothetical protein